MRVLIVKTSSMGDVIHALPALTDAKAARPEIHFDWVVEEGFAEIPGWHPAVETVIPVALRRWRKNIFQSLRSTEWRQFKTQLRKAHYDWVIDAQGLIKSALVSRVTKSPVMGYDKHSIREPAASWFYQQKYPVSKKLHAVERIRQLFSQALEYELPEAKGDYGLARTCFAGSPPVIPTIIFLHATARDDKLYPESHWRELAANLVADGFHIQLPWGADHERERADRIAAGIEGVEVLPRLNLHGVACLLAQASAVVAVDTGLGHLSAALNIPTVSLYGPTNPDLIGAYGEHQCHLCAGEKDWADLDAQRVHQQLQHLLRDSEHQNQTLRRAR